MGREQRTFPTEAQSTHPTSAHNPPSAGPLASPCEMSIFMAIISLGEIKSLGLQFLSAARSPLLPALFCCLSHILRVPLCREGEGRPPLQLPP